MNQPLQYLLEIEHPHDQTLANFVAGDNLELLSLLSTLPAPVGGLWIYGPAGSGRSHLLRAACLTAQAGGVQTEYLRAAWLIDRPDTLSHAAG